MEPLKGYGMKRMGHPPRAPTARGVMVMLGIMVAGSGLILVAGGLFGWLVLLLWIAGGVLVTLGTTTK